MYAHFKMGFDKFYKLDFFKKIFNLKKRLNLIDFEFINFCNLHIRYFTIKAK